MTDEETVEEETIDNTVEEDPVVYVDPKVVEVAKEVVAGRWGRGNDRKKRLMDAGYDPNAVQQEVNKIFNQ